MRNFKKQFSPEVKLKLKNQLSQDEKKEALDILYAEGERDLRRLDEILGGPLTTFTMWAEMLDMPVSKLRYHIYRDHLRKKSKENYQNKFKKKNIELLKIERPKLGFSISLPADWKISFDSSYAEKSHVKIKELIKAHQNDIRNPIKPIFLQKDLPHQESESKSDLDWKEIGLFQSNPADTNDEILVEVSKLKLSRATTSLELYNSDKLPYQYIFHANRPPNDKKIDGMEAITYFFVFNPGEGINTSEWPKYYNVYLTKEDIGWIISCSCKAKDFPDNKITFEAIAESFLLLTILG